LKLAGAAIRRFLDKPDKSCRAVLVFGPNSGYVAEAARSIAHWALGGSDDPYSITKLGEDDIRRDSARLADALAAQSLLGGPTLVWARVDTKAADASLLHALAGIEAGEAGGFLLIEGGELSASGELAKAFGAAKHAASMALYEESDSERGAFARDLAQEMGVSFDRDAQEMFFAALPADRMLARREIEKLALYAHGLERPLSEDDLSQLMAGESESEIDAASLAAISGRAAEAIEALARVDALSGVSALRALQRRVLQLADLRALMDEGMSAGDAVGKLRPPVFWKQRDAIAGHARAWNAKKLGAAFDALWAAELRAKTAGAPQELIAADAYRSVAELVRR
jgi:DNA polymerase-3 subunit delta